jgi:hypothetical protein
LPQPRPRALPRRQRGRRSWTWRVVEETDGRHEEQIASDRGGEVEDPVIVARWLADESGASAQSPSGAGMGDQPIRCPCDGRASQVPALIPHSLIDIPEYTDKLADRFERDDPDTAELRNAGALRALRQAALERARGESELADAVALASTEGHSRSVMGAMLGTSGEGARQRTAGRPRRAEARSARGIALPSDRRTRVTLLNET